MLDAPSYVHLSYRAGVPIARALDLVGPSWSMGSART
jgi:imidazolonepropionase